LLTNNNQAPVNPPIHVVELQDCCCCQDCLFHEGYVAVRSELCCRAMFDMITWAGFHKRYDALSHPNLRILEASHGALT
jgi:hypothetical protein